MGRIKCPGQDSRRWRPDDVYDRACVFCGAKIEFFKDDLRRRCRECGKYTVNPNNDLGCAKWCKFGPDCVAQIGLRASGVGSDTERGNVATLEDSRNKT